MRNISLFEFRTSNHIQREAVDAILGLAVAEKEFVFISDIFIVNLSISSIANVCGSIATHLAIDLDSERSSFSLETKMA